LFAHARLAGSEPAAGAKLSQPLSRVRLVFTEVPELALSSIRLVTPSLDTVTITDLMRDSLDVHALVAEIRSVTAVGDYQIIWRAAASDGHVSRGVISFSVIAPAAPAAPVVTDTPASIVDHDSGTISIGGAVGAIIARWLSFISIFGVIGVVAFRMLVLRKVSPKGGDLFSQLATTNAATMGIIAATGALVGAVLKLNRESADMPDVSLGAMLFDSAWGVSLLLQIAGSVAAIISFYYAHKSPNRNAWFAAMLASLALGVSPALSSHASTTPQPAISVIADIIHVFAGSAWLGNLAVIMIVGISAALKTPDSIRPGSRVASMINAFSPIALTCGGLIVFTGVIASVYHLKPFNTLWTTPYGAALLFKLFFVALLFAAGAWNWRRMKPRLTGDDAISPMRSSATLELLLAAVVLGITAILVALELP
jgi:copper transport protein